jgi:hypothetical protein
MGWEFGWRGSRWRLVIVVGVCGGWVEFHGSKQGQYDGIGKVGDRCKRWKQG